MSPDSTVRLLVGWTLLSIFTAALGFPSIVEIINGKRSIYVIDIIMCLVSLPGLIMLSFIALVVWLLSHEVWRHKS